VGDDAEQHLLISFAKDRLYHTVYRIAINFLKLEIIAASLPKMPLSKKYGRPEAGGT
jgi:hypothetical protein